MKFLALLTLLASPLAAAMAGEDAVGKSPSPSLPNWRAVDVHDGAKRAARAPFCHPPADGVSPAAAAPWSDAAFRSALDLYERLKDSADPYLAPMLKAALRDIEAAYRLYGPYCTVGSYNGGKDAVVIFHLLRAAHAQYCRERRQADSSFVVPRPRVIYFQHPDEFPEVLSLLHETVADFDVDMLAFEEGTSYGEGLGYLAARNVAPGQHGSPLSPRGATPHPLAFVLGTRKGDPNAGDQGTFAPSSRGLPPFLRVNPVLAWSYGHVWRFLRTFALPYPSLYDEGYTSLGHVQDTLPCPALKRSGGGYRPAHALEDWDQERAGRVDRKKEKCEAEGGPRKTSPSSRE